MRSLYNRFWYCPKLYRIYQSSHTDLQTDFSADPKTIYEPSVIENYGNKLGSLVSVTASLTYVATPLLILYVVFNKSPIHAAALLGQCSLVWVLVLSFSKIMKYHGRMTNPVYQSFYNVLLKAHQQTSTENLENLHNYDFEFSAWPITYKYPSEHSTSVRELFAPTPATPGIFGMITDIFAYICYHGFGRHMIYPGSVGFLQTIMEPMLENGRQSLILEHDGYRAKINVMDKMDITTMFLDRRRKSHLSSSDIDHGQTLVVCCEGNAGHYEVGTMGSAVATNYSVLGWNHPGFFGSTGHPDDYNERLAVTAVMDYAINELRFEPKNIIIFAWSIGGYTGAWAARAFPKVGGVILDATFDHVLPLAIPRMPSILKPMVEAVIERHANLNVAELIKQYDGPISIIRRNKDEIITTQEGIVGSNRANNLLIEILSHRFPHLTSKAALNALNEWLSTDPSEKNALLEKHGVRSSVMGQLHGNIRELSNTYPMDVGSQYDDEKKTQMILYLAGKYFTDVEGGHNIPLPSRFVKQPWSPMDS